MSWRSVEMYIHFNIPLRERGLDSMVTCRTVRQIKCLATSSSESQQALNGNWVAQPARASLPFTSSTRLAFNTYVPFEVAFEPLFVKAGISKFLFLPRWAPAAEMPCGEGDPRNSSRMEEEGWIMLGICQMLDRFLTPPRAFFLTWFAHAHHKQNAYVENSVGVATWSPPNPLTLSQKYPSPQVLPIFLMWFLEAGRANINYAHNTLTWTLSRGVAEGEDGLLEHWSKSVNPQTHSCVAK